MHIFIMIDEMTRLCLSMLLHEQFHKFRQGISVAQGNKQNESFAQKIASVWLILMESVQLDGGCTCRLAYGHCQIIIILFTPT